MSGSITALDNTNGLTISPGSSGGLVSDTYFRGYTFTTGSTSTWELSGITVPYRIAGTSTPGSYTLVARLYSVSSSLPSAQVASVSLSVVLATTSAYFSFDKTALAAVGSYSLAASTKYALMFSASGSVAWSNATAIPLPSGSGGFSIGGLVTSINSGGAFTPITSGNYPLLQMQVQATCFLRGTLILTGRGEVPVERLKEGDLVATKFGGLRPVRWIGTQAFEGRLAGRSHQPVRIARGSLGGGVPSCDLWVSPGHAVLVGDVLAHAGALVNGSTITQQRVRGTIEYFHIDLGPHDCVLANGAWAESYFEDRNRDAFHNAAEFHARFPGHEPVRQATCLPIVTAQHPLIEALRAALVPTERRIAA